MAFTMKSSTGTSEKYFIDPTTGTAHKVRVLITTNYEEKKSNYLVIFKGSCSDQFKTFLNDGVSIYNDRASTNTKN